MADVKESGVPFPKMAEVVESSKNEEARVKAKLSELSVPNADNSDDRKNDIDSNFYTEERNNNLKNATVLPESVTEWKYKNLYSISAQNGGQPSSWSPCRTAALATAMLENQADEILIKGKNYFIKFREYLANYQESWGVPRTEYTFPALIKVMGQATGRALLALLYVVVNITPMIQILLHILRFVLDKTISIQNTNDIRQMIVKYAIFGLQLLCIYVCLVFIFGLIVVPILQVVIAILVKIMLYD